MNWLTLFKEKIAAYCEDRTKPTNTLSKSKPNAELLNVEARWYIYMLVISVPWHELQYFTTLYHMELSNCDCDMKAIREMIKKFVT
jgi:hypothetical protein